MWYFSAGGPAINPGMSTDIQLNNLQSNEKTSDLARRKNDQPLNH
jgi:hypothetical protein